MRKIELLAPAGSFEALKAAVYSGADAVYLGGSKFGARAYASNFNNEEMVEAINFAHEHHVSIYVTVNTLIYDNEFKEALDYVDFLYNNQVDALLIQDYGLLCRVRALYPELELHASTQMHIHNVDGVKALRDLGIKRVVLARETSISEIKKVHQMVPDMEIEIFAYGALCISYSGQCLFSSMIGERSGNRGECAQACRLPYNLHCKSLEGDQIISTKGQYLLSPKDLNTLDHLDELIEANVSSIKLEGRMKRPEYVALVVDTYAQAINKYLNQEDFHVSKIKTLALKKMFNRGFSAGHIFGDSGDSLMSQLRPNHQGVMLGKVVYINKANNRVGIKLSDDLAQGDGIRFLSEGDNGFTLNFLYKDGLLVNKASKHDLVEIEYRDNPNIVENGIVLKTTDIQLINDINRGLGKLAKRYPLKMEFRLNVNELASLKVVYGKYEVVVYSEKPADLALKTPLSAERVFEQLSKLKETPYYLDDFSFISDNQAIMGIGAINNMRRMAMESLRQKVLMRYQRSPKMTNKVSLKRYVDMTPSLSCLVYTKEQLQACLDAGINTIFVYDDELHRQYPQTILASKRVNEDDVEYQEKALLCKEMGAIYQASKNNSDIYIDSEMNIVNAYSAIYYAKYRPLRMTLSPELTLKRIFKINELTKQSLPLEVIVYGRLELMITKHCVINTNTCNTHNKQCGMCRGKDKYYLEDRKNEQYYIMGDKDCFNHIFHHSTIVGLDLISKMLENGISYFRLNFSTEDYKQTLMVLKAYQLALAKQSANLDIEDGVLGYLGK